MKKFKTLWPDFKDKIVYGAIAYSIGANKQAESLAEKEGFFVLSATGDVVIQNEPSFKPKAFLDVFSPTISFFWAFRAFQKTFFVLK